VTPRTPLIAALITGALLLAGCGADESSGESTGTTAGNPTDRAFVAEMVPHHEMAVEMAEIGIRRAESPFVEQLAADIVRTQTAEIATLRREDAQLADAGVKKGALALPNDMKGMGGDAKRLRTATPFDAPFLEMMVPHHQGAIEMAKAELAEGADPELKALALDIIDAQQREIDGMEQAARKG
jgi:uncharacterized protein (DUF305 family)